MVDGVVIGSAVDMFCDCVEDELSRKTGVVGFTSPVTMVSVVATEGLALGTTDRFCKDL